MNDSTHHVHNGPRRRHRVCFTIDVLTDGSEYTGNGTLFLSVWKKPLDVSCCSKNSSGTTERTWTAWLEEASSFSSPLARYAIAGLGDATARLCADQRFKLASTKAVFLPSLQCADGLPALLLALHTGGAPNLHVAGPDAAFVEDMATLILGPKRHLQINNCQVPSIPSVAENEHKKDKEEKNVAWFSVYQDEFVTVHAARNPSDASQLLFLFSLLHTDRSVQTVALLPPNANVPSVFNRFLTSNLPILEDLPSAPEPLAVDCLLALCPSRSTHISSTSLSVLPIPVLATLPSKDTPDPGILMKSRKIAAYLADQRPDIYVSVPSVPTTPYPSTPPSSHCMILKSCTSIVLSEPGHRHADQYDDQPSQPQPWLIWDRRRLTEVEDLPVDAPSWASTVASFPPPPVSVVLGDNLDDNEIDLEDLDEEADEEGLNSDNKNDETKEANLPESAPSSSSATPSHQPQLLVLGTGCATPSAIRGASGYVISLGGTRRDLLLADAGEGISCMMSRYSAWYPTWYDHVAGIWISHSHLDHYGGLPTLLRVLASRRSEETTTSAATTHGNPPSAKRPRWNTPSTASNQYQREVCWVMAPPKVLEFLDITLQCRRGIHVSTDEPWFVPLRHQDRIPPTIMMSATTSGTSFHLQSFPVQHNCWPAYGFILGWRNNEEDELVDDRGRTTTSYCREVGSQYEAGNRPFLNWFCYSGDTRPCSSLVRACQQVHQPHNNSTTTNNNSKLVLLHEATFDQDELALRKKHSTIQEAMEVATSCGATRLVLTHFSPRTECSYNSNGDNPSLSSLLQTNQTGRDNNNNSCCSKANNKSNNSMEVGWAMDGMHMEL
eukprot:Nitzschia sp. Nitz4//scaffold65_size103378//92020//94530//NITZ4_004483-RA/size103378-exonerate_est2genome-gene-0.89-mRNA-1//1//CDS//3329556291//8335//frame0